MGEIEPMANGSRAEWSGEVGGISIYISGSQTDWLNQGMARPRNIIPGDECNSHLRPSLGMEELWRFRPAKFLRGEEMVFVSWMPGKPVKPDRVVSLLRMAVFQQGLNPSRGIFVTFTSIGWGRRVVPGYRQR